MPSLATGRIVFSDVPIPDPQGKNPKEGRPFVVISKNEELKSGGPIKAVGITSNLDQSPKEHQVVLPFGPNARSGLAKESAALCTWLVSLSPDKVQVGKGFINADLVAEIVETVRKLHPDLTETRPEAK